MLLDIPRLLPALLLRDKWIKACNRKDFLKIEYGGVDTASIGRWSSDIYACHAFPWLGKRLMKNAFSQWPIKFADKINVKVRPKVSFVIPHRGIERLPLLKAVIRSIFAQEDVFVECVVVEQNTVQELFDLPEGVTYIHSPHTEDPSGWHKAWAYNVGVQKAKADIVVCHDGDIIIPKRYALEVSKYLGDKRFEVCHLQRFLFCLNQKDTMYALENMAVPDDVMPERARQNWQGGTVAILKDAFWRIGGFDNSFVDWGGEDNEFYDRCQTLNVFKYGYLPFIHLWHEPQQAKENSKRTRNLTVLNEKLKIPAFTRIKILQEQNLHSNN